MKSICIHCKAPLDVEDDMAGETVACPGCGENIVLEPVKKCRHCNMEIPVSSTKCMHCEKSQVSIGIRKAGEIASAQPEEKAPEKPQSARPKIGIRKPGERGAAAETAASAPVEEPVHAGRKIGVLKPGERSSLPPEPVAEPVMKDIPLKTPEEAPAAPAAAPADADVETPVQKPKTIALKMPGAAAPAPAAAPTPAPAGEELKIALKPLNVAPAVTAAPAVTPAPAASAGGAPKLNLPGKAPGAASAGGAPKLNLPGKAPSVAPAPAASAGGAPKLNLAGKAPSVAPAVKPAPAPAAPAPKKAVAVQTAVPPPLPVVAKEPEKTEVATAEVKDEKSKPAVDVGKLIQLVICILAGIIIIGVLAAVGVWYFMNAPFGAEDQLKKGQSLFSEGKKAEACAMLERSARQGNSQAAYLLGEYYERGEGVEKNAATALDWYKTAAENGNADAQYMMACRYEKGDGVEKDLPKAADLYKKASDQNHAKASIELARCYENGIGVPKNVKAAIPLRIKAAEGGDPEALYVSAKYRMEGNETNYDPEQALKDFIAAGEKGYALGYIAAGLYYQRTEPAKAAGLFELAFKTVSAKKDPKVRADILAEAWCRGSGLGCPRDLKKTVSLLTPLWTQGDAEALYMDYVLFGSSSNVKEKQRASEHLKRSADAGYAPAQYSYAKRVGRSAERYLNEAMAQGNVEAYALRAEWELKANPAKAKEWAEYASDRNDGDAKKILGDIYMQGLAGVKADKKQALKYYWAGACSIKKEASTAALRNLSNDKEIVPELFKLYEEMAKKGDLAAKTQLAWYYMTGNGTEKNISKAVELYKETKNYTELVKILNQKQEVKNILDYLSKAAEGGNPELLSMLAQIYLEGRIVKADPKSALAWIEKAAKTGNVNAMYQAAMMKSPLNGAAELYGTVPAAAASIKKDPKAAAAWFKKAALKGHLDAQYRYALSVLAGHDPTVKNRAAEAASWMKKAAARNHAPALFRGVMLVLMQKKNLSPVEKNGLKALLLRAAKSNYAPAMFAYGEVLRASGDKRGANQWYQKAARLKYVPAIIAAGQSKNYKTDIASAARLGYVPAIAEEGNFLFNEKVAPGQRAAKWKQAQAKFNIAYRKKYYCAGNNLGYMMVMQNQRLNYLKSMAFFVAAGNAGSLRAVYNLTHCYFLQKNYPLAVKSMERVLRGKPDFQVPKFLYNNLKKLLALHGELNKLSAEDDQIMKRSRVPRGNRIIISYRSNQEKQRHRHVQQRMGQVRRDRNQTIKLINSTFKWQPSLDFHDGFYHAPAAIKYPWKPAGDPRRLAGK